VRKERRKSKRKGGKGAFSLLNVSLTGRRVLSDQKVTAQELALIHEGGWKKEKLKREGERERGEKGRSPASIEIRHILFPFTLSPGIRDTGYVPRPARKDEGKEAGGKKLLSLTVFPYGIMSRPLRRSGAGARRKGGEEKERKSTPRFATMAAIVTLHAFLQLEGRRSGGIPRRKGFSALSPSISRKEHGRRRVQHEMHERG